MSKFSTALKAKVITYFKQRHGFELSAEQADVYLDSYAQLYMSMSEGFGTGGSSRFSGGGGRP